MMWGPAAEKNKPPLETCAAQYCGCVCWSLFLFQISGGPALGVHPTCYGHDNDCFAEDVHTYTVLLSLPAGRLWWQHWCVYVPYAPCWFPLWTQGSLTSLLRSPRLTALSCQTNEHARKHRKEKRAGGKRERGWLWKRRNERDCEIRGRILIREWSERVKKERRLQKKKVIREDVISHSQPSDLVAIRFYYDSRENKASHCMEMAWPAYQRGKQKKQIM